MATFADLMQLSLWRLRQRGVSWSALGTPNALPNNLTTDQDSPNVVALLLNMGYSEWLSQTQDARPTVVKCSFATQAQATAYQLSPLPPALSGAPNPAALRVLEATYTVATGGAVAGQEYRIQLVGTETFARASGGYSRRVAQFGPRVLYAARLFRRTQLDVFPGCAVAGDTIALTIVPDPAASPAGLPAQQGGPLVNAGDVPLFPQQFHMSLVEYVVANAGQAANKGADAAAARDAWKAKIQEALDEGAVEDGGEPQGMFDRYAPPVSLDGR